MAKVVEMAGGCKVTLGLIPKWHLVAEKCKEQGSCRCCGEISPLLLRGDYPGFGKRA